MIQKPDFVLHYLDHVERALIDKTDYKLLRAAILLTVSGEKSAASVREARDLFMEVCAGVAPRREALYWTPDCLIHNRYWNRAMQRAGHASVSFMDTLATAINKPEDFDLYYNDVLPEWVMPGTYFSRNSFFRHAKAFLHILEHASVLHVPMSGGALGRTEFWEMEAPLLHAAGVKIVVLPYGQDYYCYSRLRDSSVRHAMLADYPLCARSEGGVEARMRYWEEHADAIICGFMTDNIARWDVTTFTAFHIDTDLWQAKPTYNGADGGAEAVRVIHTPNHRTFKGTEFVMDAIKQLRDEGLKIDLVVIERMQNDQVREVMQTGDILAEQFIHPAYSLSGIEGMATGLAVMANLDSEPYARFCRRFSYLGECPVLSTTPETLKENLRLLVTNPALRRELGIASRHYAEKYHSLDAAAHMFGAVHRKILHGEDVDLINLYHPLRSEYNRTKPVRHPLVDGHWKPAA